MISTAKVYATGSQSLHDQLGDQPRVLFAHRRTFVLFSKAPGITAELAHQNPGYDLDGHAFEGICLG